MTVLSCLVLSQRQTRWYGDNGKGWTNWLHERSKADLLCHSIIFTLYCSSCCCYCQLSVKHLCDLLIIKIIFFAIYYLLHSLAWPVAFLPINCVVDRSLGCNKRRRNYMTPPSSHARKGIWYGTELVGGCIRRRLNSLTTCLSVGIPIQP